MYLRSIHIRNNGPVRLLDLDLDLADDGTPITYVLLGRNGSGKTNVLSLVADGLFEGAAGAFQDIVPSTGLSRTWFRTVGSTTISHGERGGFCILKFDEGGKSYFYAEKAGTYSADQARQMLPSDAESVVQWPDDGNTKSFEIPSEVSKGVYERGAYAYFPSSRAEYPHWLNRAALREDRFNTKPTFSTNLGKPLFVEQSLDEFSQWLMGVCADARVDIGPLVQAAQATALNGWLQPEALLQSIAPSIRDLNGYLAANQILQAILGDPHARFVWAGRHYLKKIAVESEGRVVAPGLDTLSAGQASLLSIFGTLLRYGDSQGYQAPSQIDGICIVDEIDAHMHVDLQTEALPKLIGLFPKVQFLISGHSPLFVLGLDRQLGNRVRFLELPAGVCITAETYSEFAHALKTFKGTKAVAELVAHDAVALKRPKVFFEGETDPQYFSAAAAALGHDELLNGVDFEWVGAKDPDSGQGFNSGKDALNQAYSLIRANPGLISHKVVLLYDSDTNKPAVDDGNIHIRVMPRNPDNEVARRGVENLLPESVFTDDVYDVVTKDKDYGGSVTTRTLNKVRLCEKLCAAKEPTHFEAFKSTLEELAELLSQSAVVSESEPAA